MPPLLLIAFNFITGTGCVIFGVKLMSRSLEKANIGHIRKALGLFTKNLYTSFLSGTVLTALVQSSTAVTVITVGLVNSGLLTLVQAAGIIYGANIGTTVTAHLMSVRLHGMSWLLVVGGLIVRFFAKKEYIRKVGAAVIGMGVMLAGLGVLESGTHLVYQSSAASGLFMKYGKRPLPAVLAGMGASMLVHSSAATTGLAIVLFNKSLISPETAIALTLGANIGTCITAQAASIGTSLAARRAAWIHSIYNIIGVIALLPFLTPFTRLIEYISGITDQGSAYFVANAHAVFNIASAALFLPITRYYISFIKWLVPFNKRK